MQKAISDTTVILTNWKRPFNLPAIADAFRSQTCPPKALFVVDSHLESEPQDRMTLETASRFDEVYRVPDNGPSSRFAGGVFVDTKYILFFDDDLLPGKSLVESIERQAAELNDEFATIGGVGRWVRRGNIRKGNIRTSTTKPVPVDITCRAHLILSEHLSHAIHERIVATKSGLSISELRNDDLFLSLGIQKWTGHPSYLQSRKSPTQAVRRKNLPAPFACGRNSDHKRSRNQLVRWFATCREWVTRRR